MVIDATLKTVQWGKVDSEMLFDDGMQRRVLLVLLLPEYENICRTFRLLKQKRTLM